MPFVLGMAESKRLALLLFDHDGCTLIVETQSYPKERFEPAVQMRVKWHGTRHLIEVLEVSGNYLFFVFPLVESAI